MPNGFLNDPEDEDFTSQVSPYINGGGFGGGLLSDAPRNRGFSPDLGMLGLAAGLLQPTRGGGFAQALGNGLEGWASGIGSQRKLEAMDAENDPDAIMRKYMMQAQAKAQANKMFGTNEPQFLNLGNKHVAIDPATNKVLAEWPISATPTSMVTSGMRPNGQGGMEPIPGWGDAKGTNKMLENKPIEDLKTGNQIRAHEANNESDLQRENSLTPIRGNQDYAKQTGTDAAKRYADIVQQGANAQADLSNYDRLNGILTDYEGGKLANARQTLAEYGNSIGLNNLDPNLDEKQLFNAIVGDATLQRLKMMGGNDSNQDREFAKQIGPSLTQTAEGRKKIIGFYTGRAKQQVLRSQLAQQWVNKYGRIDAPNEKGQSFDNRWMDYVNRNPVAGSSQ